jgi:hypothetical protein
MRIRSSRRWWWRLVVPVVVPVVATALVAGTAGPGAAQSLPGTVGPGGAGAAGSVCGADAPASALVRSYPRAGVVGLPAGRSALYCGNARFGWRHLAARHAADWRQVKPPVAAGASGWAESADVAMRATLARPDAVRCDTARNSCAFTRDLGGVVALVAVAREDGKVVTAYPLAGVRR